MLCCVGLVLMCEGGLVLLNLQDIAMMPDQEISEQDTPNARCKRRSHTLSRTLCLTCITLQAARSTVC